MGRSDRLRFGACIGDLVVQDQNRIGVRLAPGEQLLDPLLGSLGDELDAVLDLDQVRFDVSDGRGRNEKAEDLGKGGQAQFQCLVPCLPAGGRSSLEGAPFVMPAGWRDPRSGADQSACLSCSFCRA